MGHISTTESTLLKLLSRSLFQNEVTFEEGVDWNAVLQEALQQAVPAIAFADFQEPVSIELEQKIRNAAYSTISNNTKIEKDHCNLHKLLSQNSIPYVILKGGASASYYPEPAYRSMGDVDFLVSKNDLEKAEQVLRAEGFEPWEENHICHIVFRKNDMHLEMHFEPAGVPEGDAGDLVRQYFEDAFEKPVSHDIGIGQMLIPSAFHHGLVLLLHTCHHLTGEGVGLRHLCDWAVFANSLSNDEFIILFETKLKAIGLWRFAQLLTQVCIRYLNMPKKQWAMEEVDDTLLEEMIRDIFKGGNFGRKEETRKTEHYIISSRGKNGVGNTSMLSQFIKSINDTIYTKWPIIHKFRLLLPLGWFYFGGRYLIRVLTGKRKMINIGKTVSNASERRNLYQQFHLYEVDK